MADPSEDSDSKSDFESDDDYVNVSNSQKKELEFMDGLLKVKKQDPFNFLEMVSEDKMEIER